MVNTIFQQKKVITFGLNLIFEVTKMVFEGDLLKGYTIDSVNNKVVKINLPNVEERKVGKWIYNNGIQNWECSECGETPKTLGYVGTSLFMTEHFKFCNHCGAEMRGVEKCQLR